ncbi:MAG: hypothetical protein O3A20_00810 [Planctomycetota bacterium]|nr:hypothetical protein [Planctomycetota bacterium]
MASYGIFDRLREFLTSRRFAWILLGVLVGLVLLYFIFVTLFFNPFEDDMGDTAMIVPAEVDWFVRWQDAGAQIGEFPEPRFWAELRGAPAYAEAKSSGALERLGADFGVTAAFTAMSGIDRYLPVGLSLKDDFLREITVAGTGPMRFDASFAGVVMLRCSFKVKSGLAFLGFGFVRDRLPETLQIESLPDGVYRLPQFEPFGFQDAYLTRMRDVLLLSSRQEMLTAAATLAARSGQESLAQASAFHDQVSAWLAPGDRPVELFMRGQVLTPQFGVLPDPNTTGMAGRSIGRFFRTDLLRYAAGYALLGAQSQLRLSGDLDTSKAPEFMKGWLESAPVGAARLQEFADLTPSDSFFLGTLGGDPHLLLLELHDLFAGDMRRSMDEAVQSAGRYQGMHDLLRDLGDMYRPGLALMLRRDDYPVREGDPVHDGAPVPLFAVVGKLRDGALYEKLREYFIANWRRFTGDAAQKQDEVTMLGGAIARSFVSPIVPGTGEIVVTRVPTLDLVIISNSANYTNAILRAAFANPREPAGARLRLSNKEGFDRALRSSENGAQAFFWFDPQEARHWLDESAAGTALDEYRAERESAWRNKRPQVEAEQRTLLFPGRNTLTVSEEQQLVDAVDKALLAGESGAAQRIAELSDRARADLLPIQLMDWVSYGFRVSRRTATMVLDGQLGGG